MILLITIIAISLGLLCLVLTKIILQQNKKISDQSKTIYSLLSSKVEIRTIEPKLQDIHKLMVEYEINYRDILDRRDHEYVCETMKQNAIDKLTQKMIESEYIGFYHQKDRHRYGITKYAVIVKLVKPSYIHDKIHA